MKKLKKILIFMVILSCTINLSQNTKNYFVNTLTVYAATNVGLNKTNATMIKGQTLQLKVNGTSKTVKWSTSQKTIASVTQNGKVVAKKQGTAIITAKIGNSKYTCKITVKNSNYSPKYEVTMLDKTKISTSVSMMIENKGKKTLRIYSSGARLLDRDYSSYNRNLYLVDPDEIDNNRLIKVSYIDIKPGEVEFIPFCVIGNKTWYDRKSSIVYRFKYDNQLYLAFSSCYYGTTYEKIG